MLARSARATGAIGAPVPPAGSAESRTPTPGPNTSRDSEWWVAPLRWAALGVWLAIPVLGLLAQPAAGRLVWTVAVASLPLFIVLVGYHRWRRICPLAFFNQIPVRLRRPGLRRVSARFEDHYYLIPFSTFFVGLWLRLIWTNGDGTAIAVFFILLSLVALAVGLLFTGKTWCNYICPVSFIEKIYTEPRGLRETPNSQCARCTACKKACPDINEENGYWKEIASPSKRFVYFAYPGLVFGFYFYYFLQAGTWDYYFGGSWTDEPGVIASAFRPGTDPHSIGFFFLPSVPRAPAAALTLAVCAAASFGVLSLLERGVGRWLRRRDPSTESSRVRHIMFGIAAFTAFVTFYSFAGQPTLRKFPWLPAYTSVLVVLTASLFLVRRLIRTQQAFAEQTLARSIIKRWDVADTPPPSDLHDAYVMYTARAAERERLYADVLEVYQDAIREVLADEVVTRDEVHRLESLRKQLQIKNADHERVMARLAEEERRLLTDVTRQVSSEKRLQLQTYSRALQRHLESVLVSDAGPDESFVQQLRAQFGVTSEEHAAVVDQLFGADSRTAEQTADGVRLLERIGSTIRALRTQSSPTGDLLADLLGRERARAVDRLLRGLDFSAGDDGSRLLRDGLCSDDPNVHQIALQEAQSRLQPRVRERVVAAYREAASASASVLTPLDAFTAASLETDPFVRAVALYGLAERSALDGDLLERATHDGSALVRETAVDLAERRTATPEGVRGHAPMLTVQKMIALRCAPILAAVSPEALEALARSGVERVYTRDEALCLEGDMGDEVFVILEGEVRAVHGPSPVAEAIDTTGTGGVIGEMAVLDAAPRAASVFANPQGARVLTLAGAAFRGVLDADPAVGKGVIRALARRLRGRPDGSIAT